MDVLRLVLLSVFSLRFQAMHRSVLILSCPLFSCALWMPAGSRLFIGRGRMNKQAARSTSLSPPLDRLPADCDFDACGYNNGINWCFYNTGGHGANNQVGNMCMTLVENSEALSVPNQQPPKSSPPRVRSLWCFGYVYFIIDAIPMPQNCCNLQYLCAHAPPT